MFLHIGSLLDAKDPYSMNTYQDLLHHFKIVCQLFVHMAVRDADEREEAAVQLQESTDIFPFDVCCSCFLTLRLRSVLLRPTDDYTE